MSRRERDLYLRPRVASSIDASGPAFAVPLLPQEPARLPPVSPARLPPVSPARRRPHSLLIAVLVGGALCMLLLFTWNAGRLSMASEDCSRSRISVRAPEPHSRPSPTESTDEELPGLAAILNAANTRPLSSEESAELVLRMMKLRQRTASPAQTEMARMKPDEAESHARSVVTLPTDNRTESHLRCVGWRATRDCSPHGSREPERDAPCDEVIPHEQSGYCEVEDTLSGERFRVMLRHCNSVKPGAMFRCDDADEFVNFPLRAQEAVDKSATTIFAMTNTTQQQTKPSEGIVMVVYPKLLASAYAGIRVLREVLGCRLPFEVWYRPQELQNLPGALDPIKKLADADGSGGGITFRAIDDPRATHFRAKIFALCHSSFDHVLFLDADNVPVRDPSFLFFSREFESTGAVFWPDFWHPSHTVFNIHNQSLLWELLDLPFVDMFEQESGQLLVDRRRHAAPLELVFFYAFHEPSLLEKHTLAYGDKDLFRLAWLKLAAPFHMIEAPPGVAGKVVSGVFCGMTMVQHDAQGEVLFLHRNSHKLRGFALHKPVSAPASAIKRVHERLRAQHEADGDSDAVIAWDEVKEVLQNEPLAKGEKGLPAPTLWAPEPDGYPDVVVWTHLLSFRSTSSRESYDIQTFKATPEFPTMQDCYGQRELNGSEHFFYQDVADLSFAGLETELRRFAMEAVELRQVSLSTPISATPSNKKQHES